MALLNQQEDIRVLKSAYYGIKSEVIQTTRDFGSSEPELPEIDDSSTINDLIVAITQLEGFVAGKGLEC